MTTPSDSTKPTKAPADWWLGLKDNFSKDASTGFVVFLLALPLSLGIAKAAGIPPLMGVISAIIGGLIVTFFTGSLLTIKGPAAGLITIVGGAVIDFGGDEAGWRLAAGVFVCAGLLQVVFGLVKLGKFVDFFPLSAIHGMLAAIGLIIILKQIPVLLNVDPSLSKGKGPFELLMSIPEFLAQMNLTVAVIGVVSLIIMLAWPKVKQPHLKLIPAPLLVLIFAIPASLVLNLAESSDYTLVSVGNLLDYFAINADFSGWSQTGTFIKFTLMLALVGSVESLLTVKAIDLIDPYQRHSKNDQDLVGVGIGNTLAGLMGGYPMISEVARSSANVQNGARTRWANFFHGVFLLGFVLLAYPVLEMIPNAALAAMLIAVGFKLAHPKEFKHMFDIGWDQLAIFLITIVLTLVQDLLVGIGAGILLKFIIHFTRGVTLKSVLKSSVEVEIHNDLAKMTIHRSAIFSNYIGIKKYFDQIPGGKELTIQFHSDVKLVDHSFMSNLEAFKTDYLKTGGQVEVLGLEQLKALSPHPMAARYRAF